MNCLSLLLFFFFLFGQFTLAQESDPVEYVRSHQNFLPNINPELIEQLKNPELGAGERTKLMNRVRLQAKRFYFELFRKEQMRDIAQRANFRLEVSNQAKQVYRSLNALEKYLSQDELPANYPPEFMDVFNDFESFLSEKTAINQWVSGVDSGGEAASIEKDLLVAEIRSGRFLPSLTGAGNDICNTAKGPPPFQLKSIIENRGNKVIPYLVEYLFDKYKDHPDPGHWKKRVQSPQTMRNLILQLSDSDIGYRNLDDPIELLKRKIVDEVYSQSDTLGLNNLTISGDLSALKSCFQPNVWGNVKGLLRGPQGPIERALFPAVNEALARQQVPALIRRGSYSEDVSWTPNTEIPADPPRPLVVKNPSNDELVFYPNDEHRQEIERMLASDEAPFLNEALAENEKKNCLEDFEKEFKDLLIADEEGIFSKMIQLKDAKMAWFYAEGGRARQLQSEILKLRSAVEASELPQAINSLVEKYQLELDPNRISSLLSNPDGLYDYLYARGLYSAEKICRIDKLPQQYCLDKQDLQVEGLMQSLREKLDPNDPAYPNIEPLFQADWRMGHLIGQKGGGLRFSESQLRSMIGVYQRQLSIKLNSLRTALEAKLGRCFELLNLQDSQCWENSFSLGLDNFIDDIEKLERKTSHLAYDIQLAGARVKPFRLPEVGVGDPETYFAKEEPVEDPDYSLHPVEITGCTEAQYPSWEALLNGIQDKTHLDPEHIKQMGVLVAKGCNQVGNTSPFFHRACSGKRAIKQVVSMTSKYLNDVGMMAITNMVEGAKKFSEWIPGFGSSFVPKVKVTVKDTFSAKKQYFRACCDNKPYPASTDKLKWDGMQIEFFWEVDPLEVIPATAFLKSGNKYFEVISDYLRKYQFEKKSKKGLQEKVETKLDEVKKSNDPNPVHGEDYQKYQEIFEEREFVVLFSIVMSYDLMLFEELKPPDSETLVCPNVVKKVSCHGKVEFAAGGSFVWPSFLTAKTGLKGGFENIETIKCELDGPSFTDITVDIQGGFDKAKIFANYFYEALVGDMENLVDKITPEWFRSKGDRQEKLEKAGSDNYLFKASDEYLMREERWRSDMIKEGDF